MVLDHRQYRSGCGHGTAGASAVCLCRLETNTEVFVNEMMRHLGFLEAPCAGTARWVGRAGPGQSVYTEV